MYVITESACARSCVHYYFPPIANFSKNQIFGSASSYGNSASSKNTHLNSPSSCRNSPSSRENSYRVRWKGILCILMMIHRLDFTGFEPSIFNFYSSVAVLGRKK